MRRNCLLHDAFEGQMTGVKGAGLIGRRRRRIQLPDDFSNRIRYSELKKEE